MVCLNGCVETYNLIPLIQEGIKNFLLEKQNVQNISCINNLDNFFKVKYFNFMNKIIFKRKNWTKLRQI